MRFGTSLLVLAVLAMTDAAWKAPKDLKWWQTGVIYQVYARSFKNSTGNGVGDLMGIISKLPYLRDLGVDALWISPIFPSPQADFGYDISHFTDIDEQYGSLKDFDKLVEEAHRLRLRIILDIVPNHTSDEHPWFIASQDPDHPDHSKYKDYYVWLDGRIDENGQQIPPNNWRSRFCGSAWTYSDKRKQFYLHQFLKKQPDLDFRYHEVVNVLQDTIRFWMDHKVDGFRIDAVPFIYEDSQFRDEPLSGTNDDENDYFYLDHIYTQHHPDNYELVRKLHQVVSERKDADRVMMLEAYAPLEDVVKYYGTKDRPISSFPFNFFLLTDLNRNSDATQFANVINKWMSYMNEDRWPNWQLGNHDNYRIATRYGSELIDALNMLLLTLPGTAITYYGEEIGMEDNYIKWEETLDPQALNKGPKKYLEFSRDPCRTPMQWDNSTSAGFSKNSKTWLPLNPNYREVNIKKQVSQRSHISIYTQMLRLRKRPILQKGDVNVSATRGLLIVERTLENEPTVTLVVNLSDKETTWSHAALHKMKYYTSSLNFHFKDGERIQGGLKIPPYAALLLML